jgi:uncharacterized protein
VTVLDELTGFVALQRLLNRRGALQRERETPPEQLTALRARFSERHEALAEREQRRDALQAEQAAVQKEAELLREEREHFRKQRSQVTNMKQLSAVVSELDHVESQLKAKEDRLLELWQELETTQAAIAELAGESDEERALREEAEATWEVRRRAGEAELTEVERQVREVQRQLGEQAWIRFKKLWGSRKPLAVVPMQGESCSACHAELRPSLVQLVRAAEVLQYCDSCRRLLYDPERFPDAT